MKILCDFCKTEYRLGAAPNSPVSCAVCGNVWTASAPPRRKANNALVLIASICALLSVIIFAFVIIALNNSKSNEKKYPLITKITQIETIVDAFGEPHFVVRGTIVNQTDQLRGVPYVVIMSKNADGEIISRQKFMPPATLLEPGASVSFMNTLSTSAKNITKLTAQLKE